MSRADASLSPPPKRLDGLRVLVVDAEADARRMLLKVLESASAHVTTAASDTDALAALTAAIKNGEIPEVLVATWMPDQDGYDLIRKVRKQGHSVEDLPAVALTAFARKDDAHEATLAGFQVQLAKPVNIGDLTGTIARLAGRTI